MSSWNWRDPMDFERRIFVKAGWRPRCSRERSRVLRSATTPSRLETATDPYQPAERKFRLTRLDARGSLPQLSGLHSFHHPPNRRWSARDIDILARINQRSDSVRSNFFLHHAKTPRLQADP